MVLQTVAGHRVGEDVADLEHWMHGLEGCPSVTYTVHVQCTQPAHADEPGTWFYVEADASDALARRRCLSCGHVVSSFDTAERWTAPRMWSCHSCGQSIAEVVAGMHAEDTMPEGQDDVTAAIERITWVAVGVRCVDCGGLDGVADFVIPPASYDEAVAQI